MGIGNSSKQHDMNDNNSELNKHVNEDGISLSHDETSSNKSKTQTTVALLEEPKEKLVIINVEQLENSPQVCLKDPRKGTMFRPKEYAVYMLGVETEPLGAPLSYEPGDRNSFVTTVLVMVLAMLLITVSFNCLVFFVFGVQVGSDGRPLPLSGVTSAANRCLNLKLFEKADVNASQSEEDEADTGTKVRIPPLHVAFNGVIGIILVICGAVGIFIMHYVMFCSACSRQMGCGLVCLFITTICMSLITAFMTSKLNTTIVMGAVGITLLVVAACVGLSLCKFDFTSLMLLVLVAGIALSGAFLIVGICSLLGYYFKPIYIGILVASALLSSLTLVIQLQMVLGGKSIELGEEDYILGAYMLYISIVNIFLDILRIMALIDE